VLSVTRTGSGPPVVLVHGSVVGAAVTFKHQQPLAERWTLIMADRPGFGDSPPLERNDFEQEAPLFAELLGDGAHLVGHSYGAVIALHMAAQRPEAVWSLAISEPGTLRLAAGNPAADAMIAHGEELYGHSDEIDPLAFLRLFRSGVNSGHATPDALAGELLHGAKLAMRERPPWESEPPLEALAAAPFPKLVISGGHSEAFDAVCDNLAAAIGAQRAVVTGRNHTIPSAPGYNAVLEEHLSAATAFR